MLILVLGMFQEGRSDAAWIISLVLPISYVTSLIVGAPVHFVLVKLHKTKVIYYLLAAVLATLVPIFAIFVFPAASTCENSPYFLCILPSHYAIMGLMVFVGVVISAAFWFIARPDRSAA
jgi:hypothetical protein